MHRTIFRFIFATAILLSLWTATLAQSSGFDTARMDRSVDACDDFFQFANGTWLKNTAIPASQSSWGSFNILAESNRDFLRDILENAAMTKASAGSDSQMIGDFYSACMDEAAIEKAGTKPLNKFFKQIAKIKSANDVKAQIGMLHKWGVPAVFRHNSTPDLKNSNVIILSAGQSGLTLPNRDYYTKEDAKSVETRAKFVAHMTNMFKLLGDSPANAATNAAAVMAIQTRLAKASKSHVEMRDNDKNYNRITFTDAQKVVPNFSLTDYLRVVGYPAQAEIDFRQTGFFKEVDAMMADVSVSDWKNYLRWMVVNANVAGLPNAFVDENFEFQGKYLNGRKEQLPRWRRCVAATDTALGEALGMEYVKTKFAPEQKARMDKLISNLFAAMKLHIDDLAWMGPETKAKAIEKLNAYKRKIGYPEKLRGYKGLAVTRKSYAENLLATGAFGVTRNIADLGKPTDKTRWNISAPTVNAFYNSVNNDILFPAGILQPPFFNFKADDAINYGAIGGVIGHEITHGFDDQGSKFGADGNLDMWWTTEDRARFDERATCVADQFSSYEVQPNLFMNGRLTLGESIGDLGGLAIAFDAFQKSMEGKPRPADIDGFSPEQRFFLGWAQVWASKATLEADRLQVQTGPHALARWRVNGPFSNMPEFAKAYGCKAPSKMIREKVCEIW